MSVRRIAVAVASVAAATAAALPAQAATVAPAAKTTTAAASTWTTAPALAPKPRTAVPWKSVGAGWVSFTATKGSTTTLYLASPQGQAYVIATVPRYSSVRDVRPDGRAVVLSRGGDGIVQVVDLVTGRAGRAIKADDGKFTRPSGAAVLTSTYNQKSKLTTITRVGYDGKVQVSRAMSASFLARPDDGRTLVATIGNHTVALDNATLKPVRNYTVPKGYTSCAVIGTWDKASFLETCTPAKGGPEQKFSQSLAGGAPVQRTFGNVGGAAWGWGFAWSTKFGTIATAPSGDNDGLAAFVMKGTKPVRLETPAGYATEMVVNDVVDNKIHYLTARCDVGPRDVTIVDPAARRVVRVAGSGTKISGDVVGAEVVGSRQG